MSDALVFEDACSRAFLGQLQQVASGDACVLLRGEPGTGKRLVARHLHRLSARAGGPFWAVNCGAFSAGPQIERDMLGYAKGVFRGAFVARAGWFELAQHGTLFLDEILAMPLALQASLLAILQTGKVARWSAEGDDPIGTRVDVRLVVAMMDEDLVQAVADGRLLQGLHEWLCGGGALSLPTLSQRQGDILPLARHFIAHYRRRLNYPQVMLDDQACAHLRAYHWPGNIRELENVIHHALLICEDSVIRAKDLRLPRADVPAPANASGQPQTLLLELESLLGRLCEAQPGQLFSAVESALVRSAYAHAGHNQIRAAQLLGVSRNVLRGRLIEYGEISALK